MAVRCPRTGADRLTQLVGEIHNCRLCVETPASAPLPHEPRPVLQVDARARVGVFGQAPGLKVHHSGRPFTDPSGVRLRSWMGVSDEEFYDSTKIAILPMGFCFPGYTSKGADLPPRKECAPQWRQRVMAELPEIKVFLLVGRYSQQWHLGPRNRKTLTQTVAAWRDFIEAGPPKLIPLPHPSWRNNAWIARNPWFEEELLPELRGLVRDVLAGS